MFYRVLLCDPTVVICYLIWPCDIAVHITTKLSSCVEIIRRTSLRFPSWCPESTHPTDSCFQDTSCENLMMYGGLYQHTRVVLYITQMLKWRLISFRPHVSCLLKNQKEDHLISEGGSNVFVKKKFFNK